MRLTVGKVSDTSEQVMRAVSVRYDGEETDVSASVPGLQVPERGVVAEPRIGQFRRCHEWVVFRVLIGVAD